MNELLKALAKKSEYHAIGLIIIIGVLDQQMWIMPGLFEKLWPILAGYAGLRMSGKIGRASVK